MLYHIYNNINQERNMVEQYKQAKKKVKGALQETEVELARFDEFTELSMSFLRCLDINHDHKASARK